MNSARKEMHKISDKLRKLHERVDNLKEKTERKDARNMARTSHVVAPSQNSSSSSVADQNVMDSVTSPVSVVKRDSSMAAQHMDFDSDFDLESALEVKISDSVSVVALPSSSGSSSGTRKSRAVVR